MLPESASQPQRRRPDSGTLRWARNVDWQIRIAHGYRPYPLSGFPEYFAMEGN
jgi:hypothetical protein